MTHYFISDIHAWHSRIIELCNRPFTDTEHMNTVLLDNLNTIVQPDDVLWNLGDVCYGKLATEENIAQFLSQIKCRNHILIEGNHDYGIIKSTKLRSMFKAIIPVFIGYIQGEPIVLTHRPPNDERDSLIAGNCQLWASRHPNIRIFYGHVHNNSLITPYNLCVENHGYAPVSLEYIMSCEPNIEMFYPRM